MNQKNATAEKSNVGNGAETTNTDPLSELKERHVKEIIDEYPLIGEILEEYDIGCVTCNVGTCLLKDVVEYHYLPEERKHEMWQRIADAVTSGVRRERKNGDAKTLPAKNRELSYSPPAKKLVDEHVLIKRWLKCIPGFIAGFDMESAGDRQTALEGINFIRNYADRYHHAKEEEILFEYFDQTQEIFRVMHEDHKTARGHVKSMLEALERLDREKLTSHLEKYAELLKEHIKKEDEILYPWIDRQLTDRQVGELHQKFLDADKKFDSEGIPETCEIFVEKMERKYDPNGGE